MCLTIFVDTKRSVRNHYSKTVISTFYHKLKAKKEAIAVVKILFLELTKTTGITFNERVA